MQLQFRQDDGSCRYYCRDLHILSTPLFRKKRALASPYPKLASSGTFEDSEVIIPTDSWRVAFLEGYVAIKGMLLDLLERDVAIMGSFMLGFVSEGVDGADIVYTIRSAFR